MLDDGHRPLGTAERGELVDQSPRRIGVEDVQVRKLLAAVLDHFLPPRMLADDAIAGSVLMRILPVAQRPGMLEGEVDGGEAAR